MSLHSASTENPTARSRQSDRWDSLRLLGGVTSLLLALVGVICLAVLAAGEEIPSTTSSSAKLALAITATLAGLFGARSGFGAQQAADREAAVTGRVEELFAELHVAREEWMADKAARAEFATVLQQFVANQGATSAHSAKARADVAKLQEDVSDIRTGLAEMSLRVPSGPDLYNHLKAYIDTMFAEFSKRVAEAEKRGEKRGESRGYLEAVRARPDMVNGSADLHLVRGE